MGARRPLGSHGVSDTRTLEKLPDHRAGPLPALEEGIVPTVSARNLRALTLKNVGERVAGRRAPQAWRGSLTAPAWTYRANGRSTRSRDQTSRARQSRHGAAQACSLPLPSAGVTKVTIDSLVRLQALISELRRLGRSRQLRDSADCVQ